MLSFLAFHFIVLAAVAMPAIREVAGASFGVSACNLLWPRHSFDIQVTVCTYATPRIPYAVPKLQVLADSLHILSSPTCLFGKTSQIHGGWAGVPAKPVVVAGWAEQQSARSKHKLFPCACNLDTSRPSWSNSQLVFNSYKHPGEYLYTVRAPYITCFQVLLWCPHTLVHISGLSSISETLA